MRDKGNPFNKRLLLFLPHGPALESLEGALAARTSVRQSDQARLFPGQKASVISDSFQVLLNDPTKIITVS